MTITDNPIFRERLDNNVVSEAALLKVSLTHRVACVGEATRSIKDE